MSILFGGDKVRPQLSAACRTGACVGECVVVWRSSQSREAWLPERIRKEQSQLPPDPSVRLVTRSKWKREGKA